MVVPDFALICEIMLVAEGFLESRLLARKFITLYTLCKELLSKQVMPRRRLLDLCSFGLTMQWVPTLCCQFPGDYFSFMTSVMEENIAQMRRTI